MTFHQIIQSMTTQKIVINKFLFNIKSKISIKLNCRIMIKKSLKKKNQKAAQLIYKISTLKSKLAIIIKEKLTLIWINCKLKSQ